MAGVPADAHGRAIAFVLALGQAHELPHGLPLLDQPQRVPVWIVADRGYTSHAFCSYSRDLGAQFAIPMQYQEASAACPDWSTIYGNQVERLWARLKEWRAVAIRYVGTTRSFIEMLCLEAVPD